jgi:hypothetical protein
LAAFGLSAASTTINEATGVLLINIYPTIVPPWQKLRIPRLKSSVYIIGVQRPDDWEERTVGMKYLSRADSWRRLLTIFNFT